MSKKIRDSARGETCTFRIPGVCNGDPETTVLCHAPHPKKGMGIKGPDTWAAYGCSACHDEMDGRTCSHVWHKACIAIDDDVYVKPDSLFDDYWYRAIRETQDRLIAKGLIKT